MKPTGGRKTAAGVIDILRVVVLVVAILGGAYWIENTWVSALPEGAQVVLLLLGLAAVMWGLFLSLFVEDMFAKRAERRNACQAVCIDIPNAKQDLF